MSQIRAQRRVTGIWVVSGRKVARERFAAHDFGNLSDWLNVGLFAGTAGGRMVKAVGSPSETLDFKDLLTRLDSDLEFLDEVVGMFEEEYPTLLANLDKGIAVEDFVLAERAAHTLKGMLGNLSMAEARATASRIEMAARAKSKAETVEAIPPLRGQVVKALETLEQCRMAARS